MSGFETDVPTKARIQRSLTHKTSRLFGKRDRDERRSEGSINSDRASLGVDNMSPNELSLTTSGTSTSK